MELSAAVYLLIATRATGVPKIIDFSLDYLRAGQFRDTYARCQVWRQGRRVANVAITAWQDVEAQPIATARVHFKIQESSKTHCPSNHHRCPHLEDNPTQISARRTQPSTRNW